MTPDDLKVWLDAGALGVIVLFGSILLLKVWPAYLGQIKELVDKFDSALERHEDDHRTEMHTMAEAHRNALEAVARGQDRRTELLNQMAAQMQAQTVLIQSVIRPPSARTRASDSGERRAG